MSVWNRLPSFLKPKHHTGLKAISDQVIVITGASSGIGLMTALSAAEQGARLVLASRNEKALAEAQQKVEALGADAIHVVADVGIEEDVQSIANAAISHFGGFDTWVNCAGVSIIGRIGEIDDNDNRRLFDTNFWGIVYGSQIATAHLKYKGGAIINIGSILSDVSIPLQGMYSASKHAVKGFTDSLRMELEADKARVSLTLIKPASIGTPFFAHAKNYTHQEVKAPGPVYAPQDVAYAILHAAQHRVRDVRVGGSGYIMATASAHMPRLMDWFGSRYLFDTQLSDHPKSRTKNNLHEASSDGEVHGKNMPEAMPSLYTRASLHPMATGVVLSALGVAAYVILGRKGRIGKAALTGLNLLLPMQNAVTAKNLQKLLTKKNADHVINTVRKGFQTNMKAVNNNAETVKKKAFKFFK